MSSRHLPRTPEDRQGEPIDPVRWLCEYAATNGLELASYHDACRQLATIMGTAFDEDDFARQVARRLVPDSARVADAVRESQAALLDGA
jgi:hypothetical protein